MSSCFNLFLMYKYIWVIVRSKSVSSLRSRNTDSSLGSLCGAHPWILCQRHLSLIIMRRRFGDCHPAIPICCTRMQWWAGRLCPCFLQCLNLGYSCGYVGENDAVTGSWFCVGDGIGMMVFPVGLIFSDMVCYHKLLFVLQYGRNTGHCWPQLYTQWSKTHSILKVAFALVNACASQKLHEINSPNNSI